MKNSRLRLHNLVMYYDVSTVRQQCPCMSLRTHLVNHVMLQNVIASLLKKIIPFVNGYDKWTFSYEKGLPNKRVVEKVR